MSTIGPTSAFKALDIDGAVEWDTLATALNRYGIRHVAPARRVGGRVPRGEELFYRLARSPFVRLGEAIVLFLLTHPDLDTAARSAIERLDGDARLKAMYRYVAACSLQRMWWTRLATDLGPRRLIQPIYLDDLDLPPLDKDFGRTTLLALCDQEEARFGYHAWAGYTSLMNLFLGELVDPRWGKMRARAG